MATRHKTAKRLLIKRLAINIFQLKATVTHCCEGSSSLSGGFHSLSIPWLEILLGGGHRLLAEVVGELAI